MSESTETPASKTVLGAKIPKTPGKSLYEGLFLVSQAAAADLNAVTEHLKGILARADAEVIGLQKWDERRLAFPIKGQRRGTYFITYFHAPHAKIQGLERDSNLSEQILRSLFLRSDHLGEIEMDLFRKGIVTFVEKKPEPAKPASADIPGIEVPDLSEV
jgi:small subunit ribosomal protein S6